MVFFSTSSVCICFYLLQKPFVFWDTMTSIGNNGGAVGRPSHQLTHLLCRVFIVVIQMLLQLVLLLL